MCYLKKAEAVTPDDSPVRKRRKGRAMTDHDPTIPLERISNRILRLRGENVILDADLAELYGVETKALNRAVKRNHHRFPEDFMFELTPEEATNLRCQIGTSSSTADDLRSQSVTSSAWGGRRYLPRAFTEQGVAMLSSVLSSPRAIQANVAIIRAFVRMRQVLASYSRPSAP